MTPDATDLSSPILKTSEPAPVQLSRAVVSVRDLPRALGFYDRLLGLTLRWQSDDWLCWVRLTPTSPSQSYYEPKGFPGRSILASSSGAITDRMSRI